MRALIWLRSDLRVQDNMALYHATKAATKDGAIAVFFITSNKNKNKTDFLLRNLQLLSKALSKLNVPLLIKKAKNNKEIEQQLWKIAKKFKIERLYFNKRYELSDNNLEQNIIKFFHKQDTSVLAFDDEVILAPGTVLNNQGNFYTIFTPFKNKWLSVFKKQGPIKIMRPAKLQVKPLCSPDAIPKTKEQMLAKIWPAGEKIAQQRLHNFVAKNIRTYHKTRDIPVSDATSHLSPYLAAGVISPRQCLKAALELNKNIGILTWISELIWRDFYKHITYAFPKISKGHTFKAYTEQVPWQYNKTLFNKWKKGQTGFPLVDAGMRQLLEIGWMHNRLRMVTASFLSKLLLIDWRWGEKHFAEHLIDYDFAANNGGWQWCASTGADSVPYFRIFNPEEQRKKYDPNNEFFTKFCSFEKYPQPIIDYKKARHNALMAFKRVIKK
jgi:deoxyribodipyrimidine photo-lyase